MQIFIIKYIFLCTYIHLYEIHFSKVNSFIYIVCGHGKQALKCPLDIEKYVANIHKGTERLRGTVLPPPPPLA